MKKGSLQYSPGSEEETVKKFVAFHKNYWKGMEKTRGKKPLSRIFQLFCQKYNRMWGGNTVSVTRILGKNGSEYSQKNGRKMNLRFLLFPRKDVKSQNFSTVSTGFSTGSRFGSMQNGDTFELT